MGHDRPLHIPPSRPAADPPELACPRLQRRGPGGECVDATPSCQLTRDFRADCRLPSSCACHSECEEVFFREAGHFDQPHWDRACFVGPPVSHPDEALFNRSWVQFPLRVTKTAPKVPTELYHEGGGPAERDPRLTSLARCSNSCSNRGLCWEVGGGAPPKCFCVEHWEGPDCGRRVPPEQLPCPNACSGRGACAGGACVCEKGSFGIDCSLPLRRAEDPEAFIYVYGACCRLKPAPLPPGSPPLFELPG